MTAIADELVFERHRQVTVRLNDIRAHPEKHRHTFDELMACCTVMDCVDGRLMDAHGGLAGTVSACRGKRCDVLDGPCACGAWHKLEEKEAVLAEERLVRAIQDIIEEWHVESVQSLHLSVPIAGYARLIIRQDSERLRAYLTGAPNGPHDAQSWHLMYLEPKDDPSAFIRSIPEWLAGRFEVK